MKKLGKAIEFKKGWKIFLLRVDVRVHAAGRVFMDTVAYVQISAQS